MRTSHRLDLMVLPAGPDRRPDPAAFARLIDVWQAIGALRVEPGRLRGGPEAAVVLPGGFAGLRLDLPALPALYANEQGGFRVPCPGCGAPLAREFSAAIAAWRRGGPRRLVCPSCARGQDLAAAEAAPPVGIALGAVIFMDVGGEALAPAAHSALEAVLGPAPRALLRRPS